MTASEEDGELVGSGGFRVAGERAFEVLRSAQLDKKFWRPLLWFRVAAALGAKKMSVENAVRSVTLAFDGSPLSRSLMSDPLALFTGGDAPEEARWLAYALVHTLDEDITVTLTSGRGPERRAFKFDSKGHGKPVEPAPGEGTVVKVAWFAMLTTMLDKTRTWAWFVVDKAGTYPRLQKADAAPFSLKSEIGLLTPWEKRKELESTIYRDGARRIRVALGGGQRLTLHQQGIRVSGRTLDDMALPLSLDVDDPGLTLDASLDAVFEDKAYHACVAAGRNAAVRHGVARLEHHAKVMRLTAKLLVARPELRRHWRGVMAAPERLDRRLPWMTRALSALKGRSVPSGDALRVARAAEFTAFLRDAALSTLRGKAFDSRLPLGEALWETPLMFSATGAPLSLAELDLDERECSIWDEANPAPAGVGAMMVWSLCAADKVFAKGFARRRARMG